MPTTCHYSWHVCLLVHFLNRHKPGIVFSHLHVSFETTEGQEFNHMSREAELVEGGATFDRRCDWFPSPCSSAIPGASGIYISGSPEDVHWHPRGHTVGSCKDFLNSRLITICSWSSTHCRVAPSPGPDATAHIINMVSRCQLLCSHA